jgi:kumamolisin
VPANLNGIILNISGLDNVAQYHPVTPLVPQLGPGGGFAPSDLRAAYDMSPLISSADGTGQTIAIFELDSYKASDITSYLNQFGLGSAKFSNVVVDGASTTPGAGAIEVELDMEVVSAVAPGATQKIYIGPNSTSGVNDTYNRIVTDNIAKVTSTSWGLCESDSGNSELSTLNNIFTQAAAQGQSIFAAAGDAGAFDCGTTALAVDSPADDPNVVGVGGTNLKVGTNSTYVSESVWSNPNDTSRGPEGVGGGGGESTFFSKPAYQTGPGVDSNTFRHVPDVSADADPATGYAVFCTVTAAGCSSSSPNIVVGGTSAAAPLWAGVATDTNAFLAAQGHATLGNANATLYRLFNTTQSFTAYHDITTGNNLHFNATAGYDLASGIGSPDVWNFARDAAGTNGGGNPTPTPTPTNTPTPTPTAPGGTVSQLLLNPGFENSSPAPWTETSSGGFEIVSTQNPHTGSKSAWLCGYNNCSDSITQSVTLPSSTSKVVLSYWLNISTSETSSTCFDKFTARLLSSSGSTIATVQSKCNSSLGWTQFTFDVTSSLSSFAGQTIKVSFSATTDSSLVTNFFVDDTALNVTH